MKEFTFVVTESEANVLIASLAKQPYEAVAGLIQKLQLQAAPQLKQQPPDAVSAD